MESKEDLEEIYRCSVASPVPIAGGADAAQGILEAVIADLGVCLHILPRSPEIAAAEDALRWAPVAFVSGHRSHVSLIEAGAAVAAQVPRAEDNISVHRSWSADFLFVCNSSLVRDDVMAAGVIDGRDFSLRFSPWNRQLQAMRRPLRYRAHIELTGIPAHAWSRSTVMAILGSAAWVERLGVATASREDLGHFQVVAWIDSINRLPPEKSLLIEEPDDRMEEDERPVLPGDALIPLEKLMLRYAIKIRLVRAEDMAPDPVPGDDGGGDDGSGFGSGGQGRGPHGRSGGSNQGPDARGPRPGPHDERGDGSRRRRGSASGWGGSRRVAISAALEVEPWPAVEGEDHQAKDSDEDGVDWSSSERGTLGSSTHVSVPSFDQMVDPPHGGLRDGERFFDQHAIRGRRVGENSSVGIVARDGAETRDASVGPQAPGNCQLASPGLLPSPDSGGSSVYWSPDLNQAESPRSMLDMFDAFSVCLSSVDADSRQQREPEAVVPVATSVVARSPTSFRESCKKPINSVLSRPVAKRCRNKGKYTGPVRRSGRIRGRFAAGTPIRQQQLTLITRLGIAREGEVISDEALDAYLDLFARPLRQQHIDVVLRLVGWIPDALPLCDDALVECLI
uniref:Uncharacterized protein n=1 Tax=Avena sativa TaxID=4498 RepID=A0ACD5Y5Q2_AVESA